ncbi:MAG: ribosome silencing factor [Candidatus Delongbacteria bacterium]|nr:ribosome silencing factor [Candidatus Delongbacteria bacterium]
MSKPTPEIIDEIVRWMDDKQADTIRLYNLQGKSPLADWMIFCTGQSDAQVRAIADYCEAMLDQQGERCSFKEGYTDGRWIILDYIHVIIHVFQPAVRDYYRIDQIWSEYQATADPE